MTTLVSITGMSCMHCVNHVQNALKDLPGIKSVKVDLKKNSAEVVADTLDQDAVKKALDEAGYQAVAFRSL